MPTVKEAAMRCPVDGTTLALAERNGVEIDYCPECRGIWLDRGELDRIIDRAAGDGRRGEDRHHDHDHDHDRDRRYRDRDDDEHGWAQRTGRRRANPLSTLGDLFGGGD